MSHGDNVAADAQPLGNGDQPRARNGDRLRKASERLRRQQRREEYRRQREAFRADCAEAVARLHRFNREYVADRFPQHGLRERWGVGPIQKTGLTCAAEQVIANVQRHLADHVQHGVRLDPVVAIELAVQQALAERALIYLYGDKRAKETVLRIAPEPLTICTGSPKQRKVPTVLGEIWQHYNGCHAIFPDVKRTTGGRMWPTWCPDCRPRNGRRKPRREQDRALKRRAAEILEQQRRMEHRS